jgi:hypothetical protein
VNKTRLSLPIFAAGLLAAACGGVGPIPSIPPVVLPSGLSVPSFVLPSGILPGGAQCTLITLAEFQTAWGSSATEASTSATDCSFIPANTIVPIGISTTGGPSIPGVKVVNAAGEDLNIAGNPAYFVNVAGESVYVDKGSSTLLVLATLQQGVRDKLIAVANIAATRF